VGIGHPFDKTNSTPNFTVECRHDSGQEGLLMGIKLTGHARDAMPKLSLWLFSCVFAFVLAAASGDGLAAKKKISHKRTDFTAAERAKLLEEARKICIKRYGAGSRVYKLDYYKWNITCAESGY
jgi:hypothetical protein